MDGRSDRSVWRSRFTALAVLLALAVTACAPTHAGPMTPGDVGPVTSPGTRPVVLTTFTVLADLVAQVGGEHVEVVSLIGPGIEVHGYEPTPSDLTRAARADLIVDNGLGLEAWFERFVADLEVPRVVASAGITPVEVAPGVLDPHAWMSPVEVQRYAGTIATALTELDPEHAADFAANAADFAARVTATHDDALAALAAVPPERRVLVTCEGAFGYLARDLGLEPYFLWPLNGETEATPRRLAAVVDTVRERAVPAVFCESTVSDAAMRQVLAETDARFGGVLYVDSLSEGDPVPTYLDLLEHDLATILAGLT